MSEREWEDLEPFLQDQRHGPPEVQTTAERIDRIISTQTKCCSRDLAVALYDYHRGVAALAAVTSHKLGTRILRWLGSQGPSAWQSFVYDDPSVRLPFLSGLVVAEDSEALF